MIQSILSFFGFHCSSTRVFEVRAKSSWVENLDDLAKRSQTSRASVIESAVKLYQLAFDSAYFEEDDGLKMIILWPRKQSTTEMQEENQ
jgi:predicted transcriptional regulator